MNHTVWNNDQKYTVISDPKFIVDEKGFALPSILFLITIVSLVATSVIGLQYFMKQTALIDVAKVKTEYAAESGIAKAIGEMSSVESLHNNLLHRTFNFDDGSAANVELQPWGVFVRVSSQGSFRKFTTVRSAIIADHPVRQFEKALVFANPSHQLVFTGQSTINGDIAVGQPGVTIGNLQNYPSPIHIPIQGKVERQQSPELPLLRISHIDEQANQYRDLLLQARHRTQPDSKSLTFSTQDVTLQLESITDSIDNVFIMRDAIVTGKLIHNTSPLYIAVGRNVTISNNAQMNGLVALIGSNKIVVEKGASIDHAILFSDSSIDLKEGTAISAQLIAPLITMNSGAMARYPSVLLSTRVALTDTVKQQITLSGSARVEGLVALVASSDITPSDNIITVQSQVTVVGTIYSNTRVQLDGTVIGTVLTKDFYFYEAPTTYLGWLRSGTIDRTKLPSGFLVPPGFDNSMKLDVLEWL